MGIPFNRETASPRWMLSGMLIGAGIGFLIGDFFGNALVGISLGAGIGLVAGHYINDMKKKRKKKKYGNLSVEKNK